MKFCRVDRLTPGMRLARPIYATDGRVLLNSGMELQTGFIDKLRQLGFPGVYIGTPNAEDLDVPDVINQKTRQEAIGHVKNAFESAQIGKTFNVAAVSKSVNAIIDQIAASPNVLVNLTDIRSYDSYTFGHSVNVCVLSTILGIRYGLNQLQLKEMAMGAIFHDIGKISLPQEILNKPGPLTEHEMEEVRKHPKVGWRILRQNQDLSSLSAHVAYQHHERPNGQGYPRGLGDGHIAVYARIVGMADAYDAMTSERVYRKGMPPAEALRVVRQLRGIQFDEDVASLLLEAVAPYPLGSLVRLSNRDVGVVVDLNQAETNRPVVRIHYLANGRKVKGFSEVDLAKERYLSIEEVIE